jgi:hypothetical protein
MTGRWKEFGRGVWTGYWLSCKWLSPAWFALVAYLIWKHW